MNEFKFKKKNYFWLILVIVLLIDIPLVLWMEKSYMVSDQVKEYLHGIKPLEKELGLTQEQQNLFDTYSDKYFNLIDTLHQEINVKNKEISDKIFEKDYDKGKVNRLIDNVGKLSIKVGKLRFEYLKKLNTLLHEDQKIKFKEIITGSLVEWNDTLIIPQYGVHPLQPRKIF